MNGRRIFFFGNSVENWGAGKDAGGVSELIIIGVRCFFWIKDEFNEKR